MGRNSCLRFAPCQLLYFYLRHGCPVQAGLPYPSRSLKGGPNTPYARKVPRSHYHHRAPLFLAASRATKNPPANCVFEVAIKYRRLIRKFSALPEVNMSRRLHSMILMMGLLAGLAGCAPNQNPDELKEKTARATAELKQNAKAVAEGVREGWSRDHPLNVNTATKEQLMSLPGVTAAEADKVIAGRPYDDPGELVTRGALPKNKYDRIADRLTAKK